MTADEVKTRLRSRHPAHPPNLMGAGPWTTIEEWRGIDLLAVSAWSSLGGYERVGYEVKVTRADLRRELLRPAKRLPNVLWTNRFYLAVPRGLLTPEELEYEEPDWTPADFVRAACPRERGDHDYPRKIAGRRVKCVQRVPVPSVLRYEHSRYGIGWGSDAWTDIPCRVCGGIGTVGRSRVEEEAPTVWIPRDVGLIVVDGRGTEEIRKAPRRKTVPALSPGELGQLLRWVSVRPDPRHR